MKLYTAFPKTQFFHFPAANYDGGGGLGHPGYGDAHIGKNKIFSKNIAFYASLLYITFMNFIPNFQIEEDFR